MIFAFLSDLNKAQISLFVLGVHKDNIEKFSEINHLIRFNDHNYCWERDHISSRNVELIENYFNSYPTQKDSINLFRISDIFASKDEEWNAGCMPSNLPSRKFEYLLYSDHSLITCFLSGGIGVSHWFEFYTLHEDRLELVGFFNTSGESLFHLALQMKFNKDLIEWKSEEEK